MRSGVAVVLAALLAAPLVMGQYNSVVADIPFPFTVRDRTYPAGEWTLVKASAGMAHIWILKDEDSKNSVLTITNSVYRPLSGDTKLTFNRYGDRYFLSEIWLPGAVGYYIVPSRQERDLRLAGAKPERTAMFARVR